MRIALIEPDMAGNVGTILRLSACFGIGVDIIEPCGFPFSDKKLKRASMDYAAQADVTRHADWNAFRASKHGRLVLLTTSGAENFHQVEYHADDVLMLGSESAGAPVYAHHEADLRVRIPLRPGFRSLNIAVAAGIVLAEALKQTKELPL